MKQKNLFKLNIMIYKKNSININNLQIIELKRLLFNNKKYINNYKIMNKIDYLKVIKCQKKKLI